MKDEGDLEKQGEEKGKIGGKKWEMGTEEKMEKKKKS